MADNANVQIVKNAYDLFSRGDIPGLLLTLTDDVSWYLPGPADIPAAGKRSGRDGVAEFFRLLDGSDEVLAFEPRSYFSEGDTVVVLGRYSARVRATGRIADFMWVHVFTIRDGRVSSWEEFYDTEAAAQAYRVETTAAL